MSSPEGAAYSLDRSRGAIALGAQGEEPSRVDRFAALLQGIVDPIVEISTAELAQQQRDAAVALLKKEPLPEQEVVVTAPVTKKLGHVELLDGVAGLATQIGELGHNDDLLATASPSPVASEEPQNLLNYGAMAPSNNPLLAGAFGAASLFGAAANSMGDAITAALDVVRYSQFASLSGGNEYSLDEVNLQPLSVAYAPEAASGRVA